MISDIYSLFVSEFEEWNSVDNWNKQFLNAVLACDIGPFKKGTRVPSISILLIDVKQPRIQIGQYEIPVSFSVAFGEVKVYH